MILLILQIGQKNIYLCCIMDWASREILSFRIGERMDVSLCLRAFERAFDTGRKPRVFNTDRGSQYTSKAWIEAPEKRGIKISMDSKGGWADNIPMERFWRTIKYDCYFINEFRTIGELIGMTAWWITYYNRMGTPSNQARKIGTRPLPEVPNRGDSPRLMQYPRYHRIYPLDPSRRQSIAESMQNLPSIPC